MSLLKTPQVPVVEVCEAGMDVVRTTLTARGVKVTSMMSVGMLFWILMIFWIVFGAWTYRSPDGKFNFVGVGGSLLLWLLLALLGWRLFGSPVH